MWIRSLLHVWNEQAEYYRLNMSSQNSFVEALIPSVLAFGSGAFERWLDSFMRLGLHDGINALSKEEETQDLSLFLSLSLPSPTMREWSEKLASRLANQEESSCIWWKKYTYFSQWELGTQNVWMWIPALTLNSVLPWRNYVTSWNVFPHV